MTEPLVQEDNHINSIHREESKSIEIITLEDEPLETDQTQNELADAFPSEELIPSTMQSTSPTAKVNQNKSKLEENSSKFFENPGVGQNVPLEAANILVASPVKTVYLEGPDNESDIDSEIVLVDTPGINTSQFRDEKNDIFPTTSASVTQAVYDGAARSQQNSEKRGNFSLLESPSKDKDDQSVSTENSIEIITEIPEKIREETCYSSDEISHFTNKDDSAHDNVPTTSATKTIDIPTIEGSMAAIEIDKSHRDFHKIKAMFSEASMEPSEVPLPSSLPERQFIKHNKVKFQPASSIHDKELASSYSEDRNIKPQRQQTVGRIDRTIYDKFEGSMDNDCQVVKRPKSKFSPKRMDVYSIYNPEAELKKAESLTTVYQPNVGKLDIDRLQKELNGEDKADIIRRMMEMSPQIPKKIEFHDVIKYWKRESQKRVEEEEEVMSQYAELGRRRSRAASARSGSIGSIHATEISETLIKVLHEMGHEDNEIADLLTTQSNSQAEIEQTDANFKQDEGNDKDKDTTDDEAQKLVNNSKDEISNEAKYSSSNVEEISQVTEEILEDVNANDDALISQPPKNILNSQPIDKFEDQVTDLNSIEEAKSVILPDASTRKNTSLLEVELPPEGVIKEATKECFADQIQKQVRFQETTNRNAFEEEPDALLCENSTKSGLSETFCKEETQKLQVKAKDVNTKKPFSVEATDERRCKEASENCLYKEATKRSVSQTVNKECIIDEATKEATQNNTFQEATQETSSQEVTVNASKEIQKEKATKQSQSKTSNKTINTKPVDQEIEGDATDTLLKTCSNEKSLELTPTKLFTATSADKNKDVSLLDSTNTETTDDENIKFHDNQDMDSEIPTDHKTLQKNELVQSKDVHITHKIEGSINLEKPKSSKSKGCCNVL